MLLSRYLLIDGGTYMPYKEALVDVSDDYVWHTHVIGSAIGGNYMTLCGLDGLDESAGQYTRPPSKAIITCPDCIRIVQEAVSVKKYLPKKPKRHEI